MLEPHVALRLQQRFQAVSLPLSFFVVWLEVRYSVIEEEEEEAEDSR